jgi:hypothetical protein
MANVIINDTHLTNIANAIREKNGTASTYLPREMAAAITNLPTGDGGADIPSSAFMITDGAYTFVNNQWVWFIDIYGDKITTSGIQDCRYMFGSTNNVYARVSNIPFAINYVMGSTNGYDATGMYKHCSELKKLPQMPNFEPVVMEDMCYGCSSLNDISALEKANFRYLHNRTNGNLKNLFRSCYSLRSIPEVVLKELYIPVANNTEDDITRTIFNRGFNYCLCLDELVGVPINTGTTEVNTNMFNSSFSSCSRLKELTFNNHNENGYLLQLLWSNQSIDLSEYVGYASSYGAAEIPRYESGITTSTKITDDATYQTYKNHPDSWTDNVAYSRYNKTSAENTISSLPDVSRGTNNIIRFRGSAGSLTDGGAINTMTEEKIAVAAAKGWTVAFLP